ncbi:serine hydrolase [Actinopolymorpha pittospori]|uniref:Beta-lactamase class A n=1 Tax=Actinopolymorpha pittospori TaxID=648752 RepID=A0A927MTK0_9ACTN|nr:serine hydrolase [Actinopolymorpha pittospori]MBE1604573.1 beta-lactamase class A [Actinopolymorpha pittospori]
MKPALTMLTRAVAACVTAATVVVTLAAPAPAAPLPPPLPSHSASAPPLTAAVAAPPPGRAEPSWPQLSRRLEAVVKDAAAAGVTMSVTVEDVSGTSHGKVARAGRDETVKAASIIKLPLLALLMDRVDHGTLSLDTMVTIPAGDPNIVGGSGTLRTRSFPLDISVRELMELMVQVSDNTATNVLIDIAGGLPAVNAYIDHLGFTTLHLGRKMIQPANPPLQENYIDSAEVTELLTMIWQGKILSRSSSDHIIALMKGQLVNTKYGAVIPRQYLANKTGELDDVSHDSGYILLPGREVALATTTSFSGLPRSVADSYVQRTATVVYEWLQLPVPGRR